ncbi:hypothetical protein M3Y99_01918200 [Aphelenchoides fujianensis]|nr:hypothetical protein M3Y99_01918200 [Aphelenchoides fujianensis]
MAATLQVSSHRNWQRGMRKASVSAQLTRQARKFSAAFVPQLTRLDPITTLTKRRKLLIRIADIEQLQQALKQYIVHSSGFFDPIDFEILDEQTEVVVLTAQLYADELVLFEGTKRLLTICLAEADTDADDSTVAKIRHPVSGIKVFEIVNACRSFYITNLTSEHSKCQFATHSNCWRHLLSMCGCMFGPDYWMVDQEGVNVGKVTPNSAFFEENGIRVEWCDEADAELRMLILCIGLVQIIREAFPPLLQLLKETKLRRI